MGPGGDIGWKRESGGDSWEAVCGGLPQPTRRVGGRVQVGRHGVCNGARRRWEATFLPDPLSCCSAPSLSLSSPLEIPPDLTTSRPDRLLDVSLPSPHPHSPSRHARPVEEAHQPVDEATTLSEPSWWSLSSPTETLFHLQKPQLPPKTFIKPQRKRARENKRTTKELKNSQKTNTKCSQIYTYQYLKCKWTKFFNQKTEWWIKKQNKTNTHLYAAYMGLISEVKRHTGWKWKYGKRYFTQMKVKESRCCITDSRQNQL